MAGTRIDRRSRGRAPPRPSPGIGGRTAHRVEDSGRETRTSQKGGARARGARSLGGLSGTGVIPAAAEQDDGEPRGPLSKKAGPPSKRTGRCATHALERVGCAPEGSRGGSKAAGKHAS